MDRNRLGFGHYRDDVSSLSARRAWIEIYIIKITGTAPRRSLSARRAWIEIDGVVSGSADYVESLSARRAWIEIFVNLRVLDGSKCRSPQGERG